MIHKSALVSKKAKIGNNVKIGPFSIIGDKAIIGDNVEIKSHVVIEGRVTIGEATIIYPFASLCYPQTLKYQGEDSEIIIGKNNTIREYVTIQHGTEDGSMRTTIGDNCLFMVGLNLVGMNRRGFDKQQSLEASKVIREIFNENSENVFTKRIELARENYPDNKIVQEIAEFLLADKNRSFCGFK